MELLRYCLLGSLEASVDERLVAFFLVGIQRTQLEVHHLGNLAQHLLLDFRNPLLQRFELLLEPFSLLQD